MIKRWYKESNSSPRWTKNSRRLINRNHLLESDITNFLIFLKKNMRQCSIESNLQINQLIQNRSLNRLKIFQNLLTGEPKVSFPQLKIKDRWIELHLQSSPPSRAMSLKCQGWWTCSHWSKQLTVSHSRALLKISWSMPRTRVWS